MIEKEEKGNYYSPKKAIVIFLGGITIAILVKVFIFSIYSVPSKSMTPILNEGNITVGEKITYKIEKPKQGDIVTFYENGACLVKRVIATEGQEVNIKDGKVFVDNVDMGNARPQNEGISYPYKVEKNKLWVMGDNRENSLDSRTFGTIDVSSVSSKVFYKLIPFEDLKGK